MRESLEGSEQHDEDDEEWCSWRIDDLDPASGAEQDATTEHVDIKTLFRRNSRRHLGSERGYVQKIVFHLTVNSEKAKKNHLVEKRNVKQVFLMYERLGNRPTRLVDGRPSHRW